MEAAAVDKLVEKGEFRSQVAQAIAEAIDITIKAANLVTAPMLDARFAKFETKMEARFGSIEKALEAMKVWVIRLYAGLTIALFSALAVDHHWIVSREDQLMAQVYARSDAQFAADRARSDARFAEQQARSDQLFQQAMARSDAKFDQAMARTDAKFDQVMARTDARFDQLRTLISGAARKPGGSAAHPSPPGAPTP
jgi:hypothetical protein